MDDRPVRKCIPLSKLPQALIGMLIFRASPESAVNDKEMKHVRCSHESVASLAHRTPPRLMTRTCSLMVMLGDVLVTPCDGSMRLRSRGCRPLARSRSLRLT